MTISWERLATFEGGSVADLAAAQAADGSWHVFAATAVGVFRSLDRGRSWTPFGTGRRIAGAEVVAASPRYAEDGLVYVGAHDGVYRLDSADASWRHMLSGGPIQCLALNAGDRDARPDGSGLTVVVGTQEDGVLVSRDGGTNWEGANAGLLDLSIDALALSPNFAQDGTAFAGTASGLYRTRNGAESWRQVDLGAIEDDPIVTAVALSPTFADDRRALVSTFDTGFFRSDDGGRSWEEVPFGDREPDAELGIVLPSGVAGMAVWSSERAAVWTDSGLALSEDGGAHWRLDSQRQSEQGVRVVTACALLAPSADEPETILVGCERSGVFRSEDGGVTWQPSVSGLTADLVSSIALSPNFAQDQGIVVLSLEWELRRSEDGGASWRLLEPAPPSVDDEAGWDDLDGDDDERDLGDDVDDDDDDFDIWGVGDIDDDAFAPQFAGDLEAISWASAGGRTVLVGATDTGVFLSEDGGETWNAAWDTPPVPPRLQSVVSATTVIASANLARGAHLLADLVASQFVALAMADLTARLGPRSGPTMKSQPYALVASRDGGKTWASIRVPNAEASVVGVAIAPDKGLDGPIYVATRDAEGGRHRVWRSTNGGRRWQVWHVDPNLKSDVATPFVALPANSHGDSVVLAVGDQVMRPRLNAWEVKEGVRRPVWDAVTLTDDANPDWSVNIAGLAASPAYAQDRTLFAATSAGIFVSRDGAATWNRWSDGLEPTATVAVAVSPAFAQDRLVYALGLGGSVWRRQDR